MRRLYISLLGMALLSVPVGSKAQEAGVFKHWDVSLTGGTTGVGLEVATKVGDQVRLRTGFDIMPRFEFDLHFGVSSFDQEGNVISSKFDKMSAKLMELTGYEVKDYVDMACKPTFYNGKLLVDVFPFKHHKFWKNFYVTAGFYWGSSEIGRAVNTVEGAQTLVGMEMYNHLYDKAVSGEPLVTVNGIGYDNETGEEVVVPYTITLAGPINNRLKANGRMAVGIGKYVNDVVDENGNVIHKAGSSYMMEPDKDGTVRAWARTNSFKPYLGVGYGGRLAKKNDHYFISVDCGMLFWGGKPSIITHEGVDLSRDVRDIGGKVGRYVDLIGGLKVYPVLNLRLTRTIF